VLKLLILFLTVPVIEIYLLIKMGSLIGALPTVLLLLAISFSGAWLVRHQGFGILRRIQSELAQGRIPAAEVMDGALVLVGGILLMTPGFFTDALGLFFLVPVSRAVIKQFIGLWLQRRMSNGVISIQSFRR
jgi:UPF0716 protein FxsA